MDTPFDLWKQKAFAATTSQFLWQLVETEQPNRQIETRNRLVPGLAGTRCTSELPRMPPKAGGMNSLFYLEPKRRLFVFRVLEKSSGMRRGVSKRLALEISTFFISEAVGTAAAKPGLACQLSSTR